MRFSTRSPSTRRRSPSRRWRMSARAATSSAPPTRRPASRRRSTKPLLSDWRNYESWEEAGSPKAPEKANRIWKQLLEAYEAPAMDAARREELDAFVARRVDEGGVATDF